MSVLRRLPRISPAAYRRITFATALLLGVIIVTGGAVRLTGAGLGCPAWPNCDPGHLTPRSSSDLNAMVESGQPLTSDSVAKVWTKYGTEPSTEYAS